MILRTEAFSRLWGRKKHCEQSKQPTTPTACDAKATARAEQQEAEIQLRIFPFTSSARSSRMALQWLRAKTNSSSPAQR
jgi:hypothetical protein